MSPAGRLERVIRQSVAHHPHIRERDADRGLIEQHMHPAEANRLAFADSTCQQKTHYYSLDNSCLFI